MNLWLILIGKFRSLDDLWKSKWAKNSINSTRDAVIMAWFPNDHMVVKSSLMAKVEVEMGQKIKALIKKEEFQ